jgi:hypothetical protein
MRDIDPDDSTATRFRLFPQPPVLAAFAEPETVWLSLPPEAIGPGPQDERIYVADAVAKTHYYEFPTLPPYPGEVYPAVRPGPDGHFDQIPADSREFRAAHMYGTIRFVLDVWEGYFGRTIDWHFRADFQRLELVPWVDWNNAQSGWGFIETGYRQAQSGERVPLSLNFDVLAHELGHSILYSEIGIPPEGQSNAEYQGFHESASDLVAILSALHFDSVVDLVLERTAGNLYLRNVLNRVGEISPNEQIRLASNRLRMSDVPSINTPVEALTQPERHRMGEPLTGAVFDTLVEVFQQKLVDAGLISAELDDASRRGGPLGTTDERVQSAFEVAYRENHGGFKTALLEARDYMGMLLARTWSQLGSDLSFADVGRAMLRADLNLSGGHFQPEILDSLVWREIGAESRRFPKSRHIAGAHDGFADA